MANREERLGQSLRHRHAASLAALWRADLAAPVGARDGELPSPVVGVRLLERDDLTAPKACVGAQEHECQDHGSGLPRPGNELIEIFEAEELDLGLLRLGI